MSSREDLHQLIEELPQGELETARRFLFHLCSPAGTEQELLTAEELAEVDEARREIQAGVWFTLEQIKRENDL